jgi:hypothetical protein
MNFYAEALVQQAALDQGILTGLAENRVAFVARADVLAGALKSPSAGAGQAAGAGEDA